MQAVDEGENILIILERDNGAQLRSADAARPEQHQFDIQLVTDPFREQIAKLRLHVAARMRVGAGKTGENTAVLFIGGFPVIVDHLFHRLIPRAGFIRNGNAL